MYHLETEEVYMLIRKAQAGEQEAKEKLVSENTGLIWSIVKRFKGRGYELEDLYQIGAIGLLKCIEKFDVTMDVKFSTYAVPMIIGEVRRYLRDNNPIRVSRSVRDLAYKAIQVREKLTKEDGKEPTIDRIAKELGIEREEIAFSFDAIQDPISLQEPIYKDGAENIFIMDQVSDNKNTDEKWAENLSLAEAMKKLNQREKVIITKRFFDGRTQMEVADEIGISQAQVSRLEKTAIQRIKKNYK